MTRDLVARLRDRNVSPSNNLNVEAADAIEARDGELKDAWMQRDALQETLLDYQAVLQGRDVEIEQFERLRDLLEVERDTMQNKIDALRADVSTAAVEIEQLREECKERRDEWARTRAAAGRMACAIDNCYFGEAFDETQDPWKELRASAAAFREMEK